VAVPFAMLDRMKVCGECFPEPEAEKSKGQYPRIDWKTGAYVGTNMKVAKQKQNGLSVRAAAVCPLKASPTPKAKAPEANPTPKKKAPKARRREAHEIKGKKPKGSSRG
jgi:hypothetical protein